MVFKLNSSESPGKIKKRIVSRTCLRKWINKSERRGEEGRGGERSGEEGRGGERGEERRGGEGRGEERRGEEENRAV